MITVSIVTFHTDLNELTQCLKALESRSISMIFIIDNSKDEAIRRFCFSKTNVEYIPQKNIGYGAAHNIAIRKSIALNADYHLVLNSDVYFSPDVINEIEDYMNLHPDVGQLIPNTIYPNDDIQYVVRLLPTPMILIFRRLLPKSWFQKQNDRFLLKDWKHDSILNVPFHMGCFMFFRNCILEKTEGFDETFFMYMEDVDLTRRIHKSAKTIFWPKVTIVHNHKRESYKNRRLLKIHIKSAISYFNKWGWFFDKERSEWNREVLQDICSSTKSSVSR